MADNTRAAWRFLRGKGLTPAQAAGVIGSMQGESGKNLDPAAVNPNGGATGIAQWLGARKTAAVETKQLGPQLNHLWQELQGPERGALSALKGTHTPEQAAIAWQRVFERGAPFEQKYNMRAANARDVFNRLGGVGGDPSAGAAGASGASTTEIPGATIKTTIPTVDKAGFEQARKLAIVGGLIARRNPNSFLLRSGLLSTQEPTLSSFIGSRTVKDVIPGATVRTPAGSGTAANLPGGRIAIAKGADRPGVSTQPIVKSFIGQVAAHANRQITIGTGTNHNRMTTSGNVSDHWTGHAADLPQAVDSHQGDMVAAHALQVAGVPWSQAVRMAQKGGVFNVTPKSGPYKGHRVQVLWKTMVGGNHHNHVHVGIR